MKTNLINFILFQIGWFACVLSAASNMALIGLSVAILIMIIHVKYSSTPINEIILLITAMLIGSVWDSGIVLMGWITYESGMVSSYFAPYWIVAMWGLFATTVNVSLSWMKDKLLLAIAFGAIAGPLAYYAGYKLGALQFVDLQMAIVSLSVGWAIFTPLLLKFNEIYYLTTQSQLRDTL